MLTIHILDVEHGDSIVLEYDSLGQKSYGVIDSNIPNRCITPPALDKLQALGADRLSFVALTHPHFDHYHGLRDILEHYVNKVQTFYAFPLGKNNPDQLNKLKDAYKLVCTTTDSDYLQQSSMEFILLLKHVNDSIGKNNWEEPTGVENFIYPEGFVGVDLKVLLPHPREKGPYYKMIKEGDESVVNSKDLNKLSLAFQVQYAGIEIVLGGDVTSSNWNAHQNSLARGGKKLNGNIVKLPHHGSKKDCKENVIKYLFREGGLERIACISANGRSHHPAAEVIKIIEKQNVRPYCTNLSDVCKANIKQLSYSEKLDPELNRVINLFEDHVESAIQPCQGNIAIKISEDGNISVTTQYDHPCIFRGDYDFLNT